MSLRERLLDRLRRGDDCHDVIEDAIEAIEGVIDTLAAQSLTISSLSETSALHAKTIERQAATIEKLTSKPPPNQATAGRVLIGGKVMGQVAIDAGPQPLSIAWVDAAGNAAAAPNGVSVVFSDDNADVATVDQSADTLTPVAIGSTSVSATATLADGSTLPINPDALEVTAGAAVSGQVVVG